MPVTSAEVATLDGTVKTFLYRNEQNSYTVASIQSDNIPKHAVNWQYPGTVIVVGYFMRIAVGQRLRLKGKWTRHSQYGYRFAVDSYEEIMPETGNAIIEYLQSGLFKGIGPKTAERIVAKFGEQTLDIIRNSPERLQEVRGVSTARVQAIVESYNNARHLEELTLALRPYNIPLSKIVKIREKYGDQALEKIKENPYRLCDEISGIGFRTADAIARYCDIAPGDDYRIRAGILYTLSEASITDGHVYLPFNELTRKAKDILQSAEIPGLVELNDIIRIAVNMNNAGDIVIERDGAAYLPGFLRAEQNVANRFRILLETPPRPFKAPVDTFIPELEAKYKIRYAERQKEVFRKMAESNVLIITGGPGTGKTTIIRGVIDLLKKNIQGCRISLAAPTGRAAKRMEEATGLPAKTIHRLLEYRPQGDEVICLRNASNPLEADVIILDEISMIDLSLMNTFLNAVPLGTRLILVGDVDQLPSVGAGSVLRDLIESGVVPTVFLNEIFRQADTSKIVVNATKINQGDVELEYDEDFQFIEASTPEIPDLIKYFFQREVARFGVQEVQVLSPLRRKTETGSDSLNGLLQEVYNPKSRGKIDVVYGTRTFRPGDKVMQYKNNYDKMIFNGDIGIVQKTLKNHPEGILLTVEMEDETVEYTREDLDELQLAYACTIHKSQGCEYETVIIPLTRSHYRMLQRNLIYTGITRAKTKVILIGERDALNIAIRNNRIVKRYSKLAERLKSGV